MQEKPISTTSKILRLKEVVEKIGLSRSTIYSKINPRSKSFDALFPQSISLGSRAVGWLNSDLDTWLNNMISQSSDGGRD